MADDTVFPGIPRLGQVLGGKFRLEQLLGRGGMGVVFAATHIELDQRVAIKFLRLDGLQGSERLTRFNREARILAAIRSEHVAQITDTGWSEAGVPYMVMEHLTGTDLEKLLQERRSLRVADAVEYVLQACEGLAAAHAVGVIHRDLKPANLFLTERPDGSALIKVLDFGISKDTRRAEMNTTLTSDEDVMGSPPYTSPEQLRSSKHVDNRADIWALGAILHYLLAGRPVFEADTPIERALKVVGEAPVALRTVRPDLPVELEVLILRCLDKDVDRRFGSVAELASGLAAFTPTGRESSHRIGRVAAFAAPVSAGTPHTPSTDPLLPPPSMRPPRSRRGAAIGDARATHTVLVVDDSATIRNVIKVFLLGRHFEYLEAETGTKALEIATSNHVDLIILDINMPEMDGIEFVRRLRSAGRRAVRRTPVLVLTGDRSDALRDQALAAGASLVLHKPVTGSGVTQMVDKLLGTRSKTLS